MTMTSTFDRWEKDPFFSAAEEVQESADRMESIYRRWLHERKDHSNPSGNAEDVSGELLGELHTALGTAKWQLEEFDRAARSSDMACPADDDARIRHSQFVAAIGNQILTVENSLRDLELEEGETALAWVRLDEGERDELALFLSCASLPDGDKMSTLACRNEPEGGNVLQGINGKSMGVACLKNSGSSIELGLWDTKLDNGHEHRRTASANGDFGVWKISVTNEDSPGSSSDEWPNLPPPKVLGLSGLAKAMESTSKMKWVKNGFRKWKVRDQQQVSESIPLRTDQCSRGFNDCYERSKSCLSSCSDEAYDKQLYGWLGALHRQFQRSQYHIQYARPVQVIFWVFLALLLIVLFVLRAI